MSAREWGRLASSAVDVLRAMLSDVMAAVQQTATVSLAATLRCEAPHVQARQHRALVADLSSSSSSSSSVLDLSAYALAHATHLPLSLRSAIEQAGGGSFLMPHRRMLRGMQCVTYALSFSKRRPSKNSTPTPEKRTWNGQLMTTTILFSPTLRPTCSTFLERRSLLAQNYVPFSSKLGIF